jgi:hypothetical protein
MVCTFHHTIRPMKAQRDEAPEVPEEEFQYGQSFEATLIDQSPTLEPPPMSPFRDGQSPDMSPRSTRARRRARSRSRTPANSPAFKPKDLFADFEEEADFEGADKIAEPVDEFDDDAPLMAAAVEQEVQRAPTPKRRKRRSVKGPPTPEPQSVGTPKASAPKPEKQQENVVEEEVQVDEKKKKKKKKKKQVNKDVEANDDEVGEDDEEKVKAGDEEVKQVVKKKKKRRMWGRGRRSRQRIRRQR